MIGSPLTFAVVLPALLVAHHVGDYWAQTSRQACDKAMLGSVGRWACARHVASYTACTAVTVAALWGAFGLPITWWGFLVGQLVSAGTHYWADRRVPLEWLAHALPWMNRGEFYRAGQAPLASGAHLLDQSWHLAWLGVAAFVTALIPQ